MPPPADPPALLAVAHGSRSRAATATTEALLDRVRALAPAVDVSLSYVDNAPPSVRRALAGITGRHRSVVVLPLLLTPASHSKTDIAAAVQEARAAAPRTTLRYGRPLAPHPAILAALLERLAEAGTRPGESGTVVVLAAGGSADPDGNAEVARTARLLQETAGFAAVEPAFATTTRPTVADAVQRWRRLGADRVVVSSYLLVPGFLADRVRADSADAAAVSDVLGDSPALAGLVLERYREALGGDLRMNCDVCQYRTPYPGREAAVGAPQAPHTHPEDR